MSIWDQINTLFVIILKILLNKLRIHGIHGNSWKNVEMCLQTTPSLLEMHFIVKHIGVYMHCYEHCSSDTELTLALPPGHPKSGGK